MGHFDRTIEEIVAKPTQALGFTSLGRARFARRTEFGLRHLVIFDPASVGPRRMRVFLFVNAVDLDNEDGGYLVRYFTGGSVSAAPRDIPVPKQAELVAALKRFIACLDTVVEPWFQPFQRPPDLAEQIADPTLDLYRAQLYALEGDRVSTEREVTDYLSRIRSAGLSPKDVADGEATAQAVLARVRTPH